MSLIYFTEQNINSLYNMQQAHDAQYTIIFITLHPLVY